MNLFHYEIAYFSIFHFVQIKKNIFFNYGNKEWQYKVIMMMVMEI